MSQVNANQQAGGGGAVTVADGADVAQGSTGDALGANTVIGQLKKIASAGGSAVSIADGSDVAEGATTDAAVVSDVAGTVSGKLRGLIKIFADIWDSVNHRLNVAVGNFPASQTVNQGTGSNLHVVVDTAPSTAVTNAGLSNLDVALSTRTKPADQQHAIVDSGAVTATLAAETTKVIGTVNQGTSPWVENTTAWGGATLAAAIADAPVGTEIAPVIRPIQRKKTYIETTTPLAGGATFTGAWHDSELDGTIYLNVTSFADQASSGTAGALKIQATDDTTNANLTVSLSSSASNPAVAANTIARGWAVCKYRYWRVVYINGATLQGSFSLSVTVSPFMLAPDNLSSNAWGNGTNTLPYIAATPFISAAGGASDGASNSVVQWTNPVAGVSTPFIYTYVFNGATWDRPRNNVNTTTGDTGAKAATFAGATQTNFDAVGAFITVLLGTVSGTTPTLTAQLQYSPDGGTTWLNLGPASATVNATSATILIAVHPTNLSQAAGVTPANLTTGATVQVMLNSPLPRTWRLNYTITGTTPSFTISSVGVNYIRG